MVAVSMAWSEGQNCVSYPLELEGRDRGRTPRMTTRASPTPRNSPFARRGVKKGCLVSTARRKACAREGRSTRRLRVCEG